MFIADISKNYSRSLKLAAQAIARGELIVFPSDTVYILAVDPANPQAVPKLLSFKERWPGKAVSIAVSDINMAKKYAKLSSQTRSLYQTLLPGPFTIVSPGRHLTAPGIEAENGSLGIRIPASKYILDLIKILKKPITATSANLSGRTPHYSIGAFLKTLSQSKKELLSLVVDAGTLPKNKPSTVIDTLGSELKIIRRGDLLTTSAQSLISHSEKETGKIAAFLLQKILNFPKTRAIIFFLSGDLGCGKTVFARSIARSLGITDKILSPTFIIYQQYLPKKYFRSFYHFDLYRLQNSFEFEEINFLSHFSSHTLSCIEWPEIMGQKNLAALKKQARLIFVNFKYLNPETREISFSLPQT